MAVRKPGGPRKKTKDTRRPRAHHNALGNERVWTKEKIPEIAAQIKLLVSVHDYTDEQVADFFYIHERTLYRNKVRYPEIAEAFKRDDDLKVRMVEASLVRSATGYKRPTVKILQHEGKPVIVPHEEYVNPSVPAQVAFLKAKKPNEYGDRTIHTGDPREPVRLIFDGFEEALGRKKGEEHGKSGGDGTG